MDEEWYLDPDQYAYYTSGREASTCIDCDNYKEGRCTAYDIEHDPEDRSCEDFQEHDDPGI